MEAAVSPRTLRSALRRRRALVLLGSALLPLPARGEVTAPPPAEAPPAPAVAPPAPAPAVAPAPVARPARGNAEAVDRSKSDHLFFEQAIDANSMKALRKELTRIVEAGVTDITIVMSSSGGQLFPALNAYSFIRALPATIDTHALGLVASAAAVLFLAGARRSADRNAHFLFHPSQSTVPGTVNEQQLQEQLAVLEDVEAAVAQIYRERTKLSDADIQRMQRGTVAFDAERAKELDIVQDVADLRIPGEQKAKIIFVE